MIADPLLFAETQLSNGIKVFQKYLDVPFTIVHIVFSLWERA